mgnify:CR=1 FL=1
MDPNERTRNERTRNERTRPSHTWPGHLFVSARAGRIRERHAPAGKFLDMALLADTIAAITPLDTDAMGAARARQATLTKPAGSLGPLEDLSIQLAGIAGACPPPVPEHPVVVVFAADHGVHAQGVSPWPQEVTAQMVANFLAGGAVINVLARRVGADVVVVDAGVATSIPAVPGSTSRILSRAVRAGTADLSTGPAMERSEAEAAVEVGIAVAAELIAEGADCLLTGDMGIANTTASAALIAAFTGTDPTAVTGRGTGIDDDTLRLKTDIIARALARHAPDPSDGLGVLAAVGGLEHAGIAGLILGAAAHGIPVVLDGVIADAAALVAKSLCPVALAYAVAGHRSAEPAAAISLTHLGLRPLLDLDLRLGEGSGAALALPLVQSAALVLRDVASFADAGVSEA